MKKQDKDEKIYDLEVEKKRLEQELESSQFYVKLLAFISLFIFLALVIK